MPPVETAEDRLRRTVVVCWDRGGGLALGQAPAAWEAHAARVLGAAGIRTGYRVESLFPSLTPQRYVAAQRAQAARPASRLLQRLPVLRERLPPGARLEPEVLAEEVRRLRDAGWPIDLREVFDRFVAARPDVDPGRLDRALEDRGFGREPLVRAAFDVERAARARDDVYVPPLTAYYRVVLPSDADPQPVVDAYQRLGGQVDGRFFYAFVPAVPTAPASLNDPYYADQRHLLPGPQGTGAQWAWGVEGGDGAGVRLIDIEQGWHFAHPDLRPVTLLSGVNLASAADHGTRTLGVLVGIHGNALAVAGSVPGATVGAVSVARQRPGFDPDSDNLFVAAAAYDLNLYDALLSAILCLEPGDLILLEQQIGLPVPGRGTRNVAVEADPAIRDLIRRATFIHGITVIEAAGNGGFDLAEFVDINGSASFDRPPPLQQIGGVPAAYSYDSGALLVGAAQREGTHHEGCNWGQRIDCWAWGEDVPSTAHLVTPVGTLSETPAFSHTSAAAAIIAGTAAQLQGIAQAHLGHKLHPVLLRQILSHPAGTRTLDHVEFPLGVMPDLSKLAPWLDAVAELAAGPVEPVSRQPVGDRRMASGDLEVLLDPAQRAALLDLLAGRTGGARPAAARPGAELYLRLQNLAPAAARDVEVTFYRARASLLPLPETWHEIGRVSLADQPLERGARLAGPVAWDSDEPGEHLLIAWAADRLYPLPPKLPPGDAGAWARALESHPRLAFRNVVVGRRAPPVVEVEGRAAWAFRVPLGAATRGDLDFELVLETSDPDGVRAWLATPAKEPDSAWARALGLGPKRPFTPFVPGKPLGGRLPGELAPAALELLLDPDTISAEQTVAVSLKHGDLALGRIAWLVGGGPASA